MIRLLTQKDRESVLSYLYEDLSFNIFPIGDIESFGFDKDFQRIYADFDANGNYLSVFLRYRENAIYYSHKESFNKEYLEIFKIDSFQYLSGKSTLIDQIKPYLNDFDIRKMYFCEANSIETMKDYDVTKIKEIKTISDCEKLYDFLCSIDEFGIRKKSKEDFIESKMKSINMGVTLYVEEDNKIVSTVATTAETTKNAMVVGVATDIEYRKKGYATILLSYLMELYLNVKNKSLCLFYDNPDAGKIYLRLGFKFIGQWDMCEKIY